MREEYSGREVAVSAIRAIFPIASRTAEGRTAVQRIESATRISWDELCDLVNLVARHSPNPRQIGTDAFASGVSKFHRRAQLARRLLTLEDALRFLLYPRNPIDFACLNTAVTGGPGRVDVVGYLFDRFQTNDTFFEIMLGAAEEFVRMLELPGGKVAMTVSGRQAHFVFTYEAKDNFSTRVQRFVSARLHGLYSILVIRSSYSDLVHGRKMFEEQLIERARVEAQLTRSERAFERRMAQTDDIIAEWDSAGRLRYVSPNLDRLIGAPAKETLSAPQRVVHPEDIDRLRDGILHALESGAPTRVDDFRMLDAERETRWFEAKLTPFDGSDGDRRCVGLVRDVTERRNLAAAQQDRDRQLEHSQRLEMVGVLAGGVAHDFNNLLMPILGHAELARVELDDPAKVEARIDTIREAAEKASDLVKQLTVYAGTEPASFVMVDLAQETDSLLGLINTNIPANVELRVLLDDVTYVHGDASQLRQVIMNLVINAAEAIGDEKGAIELAVQRTGGSVSLAVTDDGCGMDATTREHAFEPFYSTKFTGRGLGLSAVMGIVRAHGGKFVLDTEPGRGTRMEITLDAAHGEVVDVKIPTAIVGGASGRVLLVDDDPQVREVGKSLLETMGYEVELASDGAEALERLKVGEFTAMVLDLVMPKVDGRKVLATLRGSQSQLPVILVSGYGSGKVGPEAETDGYTRFLAKPYRPRELAAALQELSGSAQSRSA